MRWIQIVVCSLLLVACGQRQEGELDRWMGADQQLRVLSTVGMVDDLVQHVGGEQVARQLLVGPSLDPHTYELVKGDQEKFACADLIFYSGLGLECGASMRAQLEGSGHAVAVGDAIVERIPGARIEIQAETDPHIWMDVSLWSEGADVVAEALACHDPENGALYRERAALLKARLQQMDREIAERLMEVPAERRYLVTNHDAFHYFVRRYLSTNDDWMGRCIAPQGITTEGELSIADICRVVRKLEEHQVGVIFPESNLSPEAMERIRFAGRERGMEVVVAEEPLYGDEMGSLNYQEMMQHNARVISAHLMRLP